MNTLFLAATHGDEAIGVEVMNEIEDTFSPEQFGYNWFVANPRAYKIGERFTEQDLNRSAAGDPDSEIYEDRRAAEIMDIADRYDRVIDIHGSVAACGIIQIVSKASEQNLELARSIPVSPVVIWESSKTGVSGPLTECTRVPGLEIECGPKSEPEVKAQLVKIIGQILRGEEPTEPQEFFEVYDKIEGEWNPDLQDFVEAESDGESFFPIMSSQYPGVQCYKMRKLG